MALLLAWPHISSDFLHVVDARFVRSDTEYLLDSCELMINSLMAVTSDQDYTMNVMLESRVPVWDEIGIAPCTRVAKARRVREHAAVEDGVTNLVIDTDLQNGGKNEYELQTLCDSNRVEEGRPTAARPFRENAILTPGRCKSGRCSFFESASALLS